MKIKLLKDLPSVKAGAIFEENEKRGVFIFNYQEFGQNIEYAFRRDTVLKNPDWFEVVK
jgi:hypothetical protein